MSEPTTEVVAFIRARLDEEERIARAGEDACWHIDYCDEEGVDYQHTFDPERMLREVKVKRELLDAHLGYYGPGDDEHFPIPTLRILAAIWDDHDDYPDALKTPTDV